MHKLQLRWQHTEKGIRILQTYSDLVSIHIPSMIEDCPVTEIGPYCFSASMPEHGKESFFFSSIMMDDTGQVTREKRITENSLPPSDGKYLEEIFLPPTVTVLHNAAFYNCRRLQSLRIGPALSAIGSDEFTNCTRLARIIYQGSDSDASALALILSRLESDLYVLFTGEAVSGALFFPEYYEWLDEVSPAHLFSRSIHGEGFRMRKCFLDGRVDYGKYDACFENALKTEPRTAICRIAECRLRWPHGLKTGAARLYRDALDGHFDTAADMAVKERDLDLLTFLFTKFSPDKTSFSHVLDQCIHSEWGEAAAWLMEINQQRDPLHFAKKEYDLPEW